MAEEETKKEEEKVEEKAEGKAEEVSSDEGEEVEVPEKFTALVEQIESMSVLDLSELVKILEKKFGVSAAAVVAAVPAAAGGDAPAAEEKSEFTVELTSAGDQKIQVIKAVKEILGLGLKEAKDMVDGVPTVLKEGVNKETAEEFKKKITDAGGSVELK